MEAVRAFNNELSALYETKPPISRAKMAQLTKCAIKAIKFYKHVVQSVEKFIQKCKPEYKVPGLYVIDSVVRQSRHQFGSNKDVFAPRFTKNIITTFQNLFKCPGDERSKIVRVLNLWQKNDVFPSEIIQPLLDLAADPTKPTALAAVQSAVDHVLAASGKPSSSGQQKVAGSTGASQEQPINQVAAETMLATQNDMLNTVTQLLQQTDSGNSSLSAQQQQLQQLQLLQQQLIQQTQLMQQPSGGPPLIDSSLLAQIQSLTNQLLSKTEPKADGAAGGFNTKLLDFDYGESDDEEDRRHPSDTNVTGNVQTILNDSGLMQQIHQMSQNIQQNEQLSTEISEQERRRRVLEQQQAEFDQQISQGNQPPPVQQQQQLDFPAPQQQSNVPYREEGEYEEDPQDEDFRDHQQLRDRDEGRSSDRRRDRSRRDRDYEKSRSRSPKRRRRSRSRSRDRRRRSRSRERTRRSRSKDREREKQKEKERERKKKALPPIKDQFVTVCSTTIWIGHLNKFTSEEELKTELEHYGPVSNINMVPPRGCAYIVMMNRKDANKAIDRLKGFKLNSSALKTAWAQSQGIRESSFKDSWDVEHGAIYIPWDSLPPDLTPLLEGSIIDSDTLPQNLKDLPTEKGQLVDESAGQQQNLEEPPVGAMSQPQPMPNMGQPPMPGQPHMMGMMPGGMGPNMPGMMPGMMMSMQRPMVPGMPPQPLGMPPGAPPQMIPQAPNMRPPAPGVNASLGMSIANTAASSLAQNIQNIMATAAMVPGSPANRPTFTGTPPRFGFNPNMPPPGFRLPPPGFPGSPMRPPLIPPGISLGPGKPQDQGQIGDRPPLLEAPPKQPEMAWPPDSNEKDDDMDEEDETEGNSSRPTFQAGQFSEPPSGPPQENSGVPPDQSGPRMPLPPDGFPPGFPPGPPGSWNMMRMPGMRHPGMFNRPPLLPGGPRGPMFMNSPGGFPRFPPGGPPPPNSNIRPPISLLDLDIKPSENFDADRCKNPEDGAGEVSDNEKDKEEGSQGVYPFNNWQTPNRDRGGRGRDGDWSRDRDGDRDRDRDRGDGHDSYRDRRESRDRDRFRDRDVDRDRDRDLRGRREDRNRDRDRHDRSDRDRERPRRERDRSSRSSRWSNVEDDDSKAEVNTTNTSGNLAEAVESTVNTEAEPVVNTADQSIDDGVNETLDGVNPQTENMEETSATEEASIHSDNDNSVTTTKDQPQEVVSEVSQDNVDNVTTNETVLVNSESNAVEDNSQNVSQDTVQDMVETNSTESSMPKLDGDTEPCTENGPVQDETGLTLDEVSSDPVKKVPSHQDKDVHESNGKELSAGTDELEEGEIAS